MNPNTELVLYDTLSRDTSQLTRIGEAAAKSGVFGMSRPEQGTTMMLICMTERITPLQFLRNFHVMPDGKFSLKAMAALAEFERLGGKFNWLSSGDAKTEKPEDQYAEAEFELKERKVKYRYSLAEARQEGICKTGSRYEKRPGQMLRARVTTNALGMIAPGIFSGMGGDDEVEVVPAGQQLDLSKSNPPTSAVQVEVLPPVDESKHAQASAVAPSPTQPTAVIFKAESVDGKLTMETVAALQMALGDKADAAFKLMQAKKWFVDDIRTVAPGRIQRVLDNPAKFIEFYKL